MNAPDEVLLGFAEALRVAGVPVTPDRGQAFCRAVSLAGSGGAGRVLVGPAHPVLQPRRRRPLRRCLRRLVRRRTGTGWRPQGADSSPAGRNPTSAATGSRTRPADRAGAGAGQPTEVLRHRDVADLDAGRAGQLLDGCWPSWSSGRRPAASPRLPARTGGAGSMPAGPCATSCAGPASRVRCDTGGRGQRPRRVVLLVDVSGSMEPYADHLLRLAHRMVQAAPSTTEVLTMGTRLTRVTSAMRRRDGDAALRAAGQTVPDWSGGTRLGEVLRAFLDRHGQRGMARGAVVVVFSDGWERGDPVLLGEQVGAAAPDGAPAGVGQPAPWQGRLPAGAGRHRRGAAIRRRAAGRALAGDVRGAAGGGAPCVTCWTSCSSGGTTGETVGVGTVVATWRSAPRPAGASMLVGPGRHGGGLGVGRLRRGRGLRAGAGGRRRRRRRCCTATGSVTATRSPSA